MSRLRLIQPQLDTIQLQLEIFILLYLGNSEPVHAETDTEYYEGMSYFMINIKKLPAN